jgi:hypothetical protein
MSNEDGRFERGRAKTGGRKKGSPWRLENSDTVRRKLKAAALERAKQASRDEVALAVAAIPSMGPLEVLLMGMHLKLARGDLDGAMQIATAAAPYTSPRLNAAEVRVQHSVANHSDDAIAAEIELLRLKIEAARTIDGAVVTTPAEPLSALPVITDAG